MYSIEFLIIRYDKRIFVVVPVLLDQFQVRIVGIGLFNIGLWKEFKQYPVLETLFDFRFKMLNAVSKSYFNENETRKNKT